MLESLKKYMIGDWGGGMGCRTDVLKIPLVSTSAPLFLQLGQSGFDVQFYIPRMAVIPSPKHSEPKQWVSKRALPLTFGQ